MGWVSELLLNVPTLAVAQERLRLIADRFEKLEAECDELKSERSSLKKENVTLKSEIDELRGRLAHHELIAGYERRDGVDWKKDEKGNFTDGPRCPECKRLMSRIKNTSRCNACNYEVTPTPVFRITY